MFNKSDISKSLNIDIAISDKMAKALEEWERMYRNEPSWASGDIKTAGISSAIASEIARLATIEMKTKVAGSPRAEYIDEQYQKGIENLREYVERGNALGGMVLKPYPVGNEIAIEAIPAGRFFPVDFDASLNITDCIFAELLTKGKDFLTRIERHQLQGNGYIVTNRAYTSKNKSSLGREILLESVEEWAGMAPYTVIENVEQMLFGYYRVPLANTVEPDSPLGISVYEKARGLIEQFDRQYSRYLWEFEGAELSIYADTSLFKKVERRAGDIQDVLPKGKERLFKTLNLQPVNGALMETFSPEIRDEALARGMNELLCRIEDMTGLSRGTFSNTEYDNARTATELKILRQRSYATVADTQKALQRCLEQLIYALDVYATLYNLAPAGEYVMAFEWDDSIIVDTGIEYQRRLQMVQAGLLKPEAFYSWYFGIPEEQAKQELPEMTEVFGG
jgi:A118 family predicted phage portal protein